MSRYDEERQMLGIPLLGDTSHNVSALSSRYYNERQAILNPYVPSVADFRKLEDTTPLSNLPSQQPTAWDQIKALDIKGLSGGNLPGHQGFFDPENDGSGKFLPGNLDNTAVGQFLKRANWNNNPANDNLTKPNLGTVPNLLADLFGGAQQFAMGGQGGVGALGQDVFNAGANASKAIPEVAGLLKSGAGTEAIKDALKLTASEVGNKLPFEAPTVGQKMLGFGVGSAGLTTAETLGNNQKLNPKELATSALENAAVGGLLHLGGKGIELGNDKIGEIIADRKLGQPIGNSIDQALEQFKTPSLRDFKTQQLSNTFIQPQESQIPFASTQLNDIRFSPLQQNIDYAIGIKNPLTSLELSQKQDDLINAFRNMPNRNAYKFTTSEQRAFNALQDGIQEAQNYIGHTDVLAGYPPGKTIEQAYADIKANTGIDLPKLMENYQKAQNKITSLTPEAKRLAKVSGVLPDLKPRNEVLPQTENIPQQILPPERATWTNKDGIGIGSAGAEPIRSWTVDNLDQLPGRQILKTESPLQSQNNESLLNQDLPTPQSKIIIGKAKEPFSFKNALDKFYTKVVDTQKPIADVSKISEADTAKLASNTKNVSGIVDYNLLKGLVDRNGNKVGDSLKDVITAIPKGKEEDFWTYMSQRHNIDRAREGKPVQANYTPEMSQQTVKLAEQSSPEYKIIGDNITNWLDKFMQTWGVDTGIVNKDLYQELRKTYKSYFPTQRDFSSLEDAIPNGVSQKFVDQRTPIKKATGSERDIIDPVENIMNLVNRTIRTAKYNEVGQSLLDSVRTNSEKLKEFAEVLPAKEGMFSNHDNVVTVLENGKPTYLQINNKALLDALNGLPKIINNLPKLRAVTNVFKNLITQKNPFFALRNIFRDIPTAYVYGSENNPIKFGADLLGAGKDIITQSPRLQRYQAVGGGGANFFNSGEVTKSASELTGKTNILKKIVLTPIKGIEKFNNLTETAPRLAEFNRVFDKTGDITKSLHASNDVTVNFSRGGNVTKSMEAGVPYLNAGVQGLDKFFRGFGPKNAIATIIKSGIAISTPGIATYLINKDNPHYQAMDNRAKDTYYLIPNLADKDENGYAKTFIPVPKSRELGVLFSSLLERVARQVNGENEAFKGFFEAGGNPLKGTMATNFAPTNPLENNILSPATWNLATNKDFADRAIVPQGMLMDKRSPYLQFDDKTTSIAKAIGELSSKVIPGGLSPKQIDYLVKSYAGVIGQYGIPLAVPGGNLLSAVKSQFIKDPLFSNQATTDFYDKLDKLSSSATDKNILEKVPSKILTPEENIRNSMNGVSEALSRGTKMINKLQAGSDPNKNDKISAIKIQMLNLTQKANLANDPRAMQRVEDQSKRLFIK